ncbi:MAG: helix-turn-helix transcriptional regulator [Clostridiales bacterium]|nr:helix-turn-helix transcriptional regulator [Clostridiales bacterium]
MEFKDLVRLRRQELGLTLDDVAKAVGVGKATVQRWESGNINNPRRDKIARLAQVLGISPMELVDAADMAASQAPDTEYIREISEALQHNPKLGLLFDRSRKMSESDLDAILGIAAAILKERDPE